MIILERGKGRINFWNRGKIQMQRKSIVFKLLAVSTAFACALFTLGPSNLLAAEGAAAAGTSAASSSSAAAGAGAGAAAGAGVGIGGAALAGIVVGLVAITAGVAATSSGGDGGSTSQHPGQ